MNINCITGYDKHLYEQLKLSFEKATKLDIIVSFLMESGVKLIRDELELLKEKNIPIRILTGNYLNITQPSALYLLKEILGDQVDLRFYSDETRSFHPKAYLFEYEDGGDIFIGSSNISKSALTTGIEWNYRLNQTDNNADYIYFKSVFENLFLNYSIIVTDTELDKYSKTWKRNKFFSVSTDDDDEYKNAINLFEPRGAQIEALYALNRTRLDGNDKGLVVAATGIGKTYLAAFDSKNFDRILFVAHREEILKQAKSTFKTINPDKSSGFFMSSIKDSDKDIIFASVQTLGKENYLNNTYFDKSYFDYIVIDEFHHAVSKNYQNIINYFEPKFLLGITATPERLDNKDVFSICDYNVVYELGLKNAIDKGWLVPFRYYGIYDDTVDYSAIDINNGKYNEIQLEKALSINQRAELILNHFKKYKSKRALGFCTNKTHAEYMAKYFDEHGVKSCAVYSGSTGDFNLDRTSALNDLSNGHINVIFSVDMFNEGLDIKNIDMVMFLRPTESPTIFLQQLGRGLRKCADKKYLNVLDFIGNYKKANLVPFLLSGKSYNNSIKNSELPLEDDYPEDCFINFDFRILDIFEQMNNASKKIEDLIIESYYKIKEDIGHRPSRVELFIYMDSDLYENMKKKSKLNIFKNYLAFLHSISELNDTEISFLDTFGYEFINMLENTAMSKTYKLPVFLAFYNNGSPKLKIDDDDLYISFNTFYKSGSNRVDMLRDKSTKDFLLWNKSKFVNLARKNPVKFLLQSSESFFYESGRYIFLNDKLENFISEPVFISQFKDTIDFRTKEFYRNRFEKKEL